MKPTQQTSSKSQGETIEPLPPKVYLWERLVARVCARKKSRIGRRQVAIFERLGVGSPWDGESADEPIGLGSMSLSFENRRSPAPHLAAPKERGAKSSTNPDIERYRGSAKVPPKATPGSGTISVREVRRSAAGGRAVEPKHGTADKVAPEIPTSNAVAPLRHRVVPAPESGRGRIRFRHPDKK